MVEQIIRPTGLLDPKITIKPLKNQIDDTIELCRQRVERSERILITTLTKRTAEDLADYLRDVGLKVRYLHSDIDTIERVEILRGLRAAEFDILVGINLLREGLDLPEVSLVCILDADKEGFLRSQTSLIQTAGRAARHVNGEVILFADIITQSMEALISISEYRRNKQIEYNEKHGITPQTVRRAVQESLHTILRGREIESSVIREVGGDFDLSELLRELEDEMQQASANLEFERAALLRDQIMEVKSGTGLNKIEPKRRPVKYTRNSGRRVEDREVLGAIGNLRWNVRSARVDNSTAAKPRIFLASSDGALDLPRTELAPFAQRASVNHLAHRQRISSVGSNCTGSHEHWAERPHRSRIFAAKSARSESARRKGAGHSSGSMETR